MAQQRVAKSGASSTPTSCSAASRLRRTCLRHGQLPFSYSLQSSGQLLSKSLAAANPVAFQGVGGRSQNNTAVVCTAFKQGSVYFWGQQQEPAFTVAKLQIGLFGDVSRFQRELNRLALEPASEDLSRLLRESCMFISSNYQYCAYACAQIEGSNDLDETERLYNGMTLEERARFKEETLVNVDGDVRTSGWPRSQSTTLTTADQWMCATFVVALDGNLKLPRLDSITALRDSLLQLGSLTQDDIIALEMLWTPQATGDSYTRDELLQDYPRLLTLL